MTFSHQEHVDNLVRHIRLVQDAGILLAERLATTGRSHLARILLSRVFTHDASKFRGIEWEYLHCGPDVEDGGLKAAIRQHVDSNDHHPEFWGDIHEMPEDAIAEMVCDLYARSQEFGTGLRDWIESVGVKKFKLNKRKKQYKQIVVFVDLLLPEVFKS